MNKSQALNAIDLILDSLWLGRYIEPRVGVGGIQGCISSVWP